MELLTKRTQVDLSHPRSFRLTVRLIGACRFIAIMRSLEMVLEWEADWDNRQGGYLGWSSHQIRVDYLENGNSIPRIIILMVSDTVTPVAIILIGIQDVQVCREIVEGIIGTTTANVTT